LTASIRSRDSGILIQNYFASGDQTSLPCTARLGFNTAQVTASGLPNSASQKLHAGTAVTIPVTVTNNGAVGEWYFTDARLAALTAMKLKNGDPAACTAPGGSTDLPGACTLFTLPTEVSGVAFTAQSSVAITMDAFNDQGARAKTVLWGRPALRICTHGR
jgi:hypothetical protein